MGEKVVPQDDLPVESAPAADQNANVALAAGQPVPGEDLPENTGAEVPADDLPGQEKYQAPEEQIKGIAESVGRGLIGPAAPYIETHLLGVSPEDITGREEALGGAGKLAEAAAFAGSMLVGTGEAALLSHIGEAAAKATEMGKVGSALVKGAIEGGLYQGGDEISKSILGQGDPEGPVSSALLHTGIASLLGGAGGAAIEGLGAPTLKKIGESKIGTKVSQFLTDMGSRLKFNQENPDMVHALTDQIEHMHGSLSAARDEIYGSSALKAQNIKHLTQDVTSDQVNKHIGNVTESILKAPEEIQNDPLFKNAVNEWKNKVTTQLDPITLQAVGEAPGASDVFQATDLFKRKIQELGKYGRESSLSNVVANQAKGLSSALKISLENESIWGKAGEFQKGLNAAVSDFIPKNQNFLSKFTEKDATDLNRIISPGKVDTYLKQIGKPNAEIKQQFLGEWVDAAEKYQEQINSLHHSLGLQTPLSIPPTDLIKSMIGKLSPGAKAADAFYNLGVPAFSNRVSHGVAGSVLGGEEGYHRAGLPGAAAGAAAGAVLGAIVPHLEEAVGNKIKKSVVPGMIRVLSSNAPENTGKVLDYMSSISRGAAKLSSGIDALFKAGGTKAIDAYASDSDKEKVHNFVEKGEMNRQITSQVQEPAPAPTPAQYFAHGGEVKDVMTMPAPDKPAPAVLRSVGGIEKAMPEHAMLFASAKGRVNNYLNSIRPQKNAAKLAFDKEPSTTANHRSYQKALNLAVQPLGILNHLKAGTLTPETLSHFRALWPEIHNHISKKLTEKIIKSQMNGEKPSYRSRQSMSLFLGAPLDSTFTPAAIQSVQSIYAPKPAPQMPGAKKQKKNMSTLHDLPENHYTQDQAASKRASAWD